MRSLINRVINRGRTTKINRGRTTNISSATTGRKSEEPIEKYLLSIPDNFYSPALAAVQSNEVYPPTCRPAFLNFVRFGG
jgi:hypothetical protein